MMQPDEFSFKGIEIDLSPKEKELLRIFIRELIVWNKRMNLTGLSSTERIMDELVADSLMPLPYLPETGICLDVGSGAGFPAIPLKICRPAMKFFLMEPNFKKGSFLKQIIRLCELKGIEVIRERIESPSRPFPFERCHLITSRAMAPLPKLVKWCAPYLAEEGLMVAFLGKRFEDILGECGPLLKEAGLFVFDSTFYALKGRKSKRKVLILKKAAAPSSTPGCAFG